MILKKELIKNIQSILFEYKLYRSNFFKLEVKYLNLYSNFLTLEENFQIYKVKTTRLNVENKFNDFVKNFKYFLNIVDSLELGLKAVSQSTTNSSTYIQGFKIVIHQFYQITNNLNVKVINPLGCEFNPKIHEVISIKTNKNDVCKNIIINVIRKGFKFQNKLIRPASVQLI